MTDDADELLRRRQPGATSWDGNPAAAEAAVAWLQTGAAPDRIVYHRGDLAIDAPPRPTSNRAELALRVAAMRLRLAAQQGHIRLVQRRLGDHDYEYLAQRVAR